MTRTSYPSDLTDEQWTLIEPLIPQPLPGGRPRSVEMRRVINAILYLNRSGNAWRMLPRDFGPWSSVYHYFRTFRDEGTWQRIHDTLREKVRREAGRKPTPSAGVLDAQSVKTDAPRKGGRTATTRAKRPLAASVF
jgi:putative transposase